MVQGLLQLLAGAARTNKKRSREVEWFLRRVRCVLRSNQSAGVKCGQGLLSEANGKPNSEVWIERSNPVLWLGPRPTESHHDVTLICG